MAQGKSVYKAIGQHKAIMVTYGIENFRCVDPSTARAAASAVPAGIAIATLLYGVNTSGGDSAQLSGVDFNFLAVSYCPEYCCIIILFNGRRHVGANRQSSIGSQTYKIIAKTFALGIVDQVR